MRTLALIALLSFFVSGCAAPGSPWPLDPFGQAEARTIRPGASVKNVVDVYGFPLRERHYNPKATKSYFKPSDDFSGVGYWPATEIRMAKVTFEKGTATRVEYVSRPQLWNSTE